MKRLSLILISALLLLTGCGAVSENSGVFSEENSSASAGHSTNSSSELSTKSPTESTPEEPAPEPEIKEFTAEEIAAAMGLGWNLGNQLEASINGVPSETAWGNPEITPGLFEAIKQQGFSTVRIPVSYLSKIGEAPGYEIEPQWLDRVQQVTDYALDSGLFVIINVHGDGYYTVDGAWLHCAENDAAQAGIREKFRALWQQVAERFKDYGEHLIFESMNEIFDNTYDTPNAAYYQNLNEYNKIFTETVRQTGGENTHRWLLIPGWNTNIEYTAGDYGFEIPDDERLMVSVHYYDPYNFTLDDNPYTATTEWGILAAQNFDSWGGEDYVDSMMEKLHDTFIIRGIPVVIGEFGAENKQHLSENFPYFRIRWTEYVIRSAMRRGIVPVYWDNGYNGDFGFGIIDRATYEITQPELLGAMIDAINS